MSTAFTVLYNNEFILFAKFIFILELCFLHMNVVFLNFINGIIITIIGVNLFFIFFISLLKILKIYMKVIQISLIIF